MGSDDVDDALHDGQHDGRNDGFDEWMHGPLHLRAVVTGGGANQSWRRTAAQRRSEKWRHDMRTFTFQISVALAILFAVLLTGAAREAVAKPKAQTATIRITTRGYEPTALKLRKGIPARVTFLRTTD